jgi:hypothetical protein
VITSVGTSEALLPYLVPGPDDQQVPGWVEPVHRKIVHGEQINKG